MKSSITQATELQRRLLDDPRLRPGLDCGEARAGHPAGRVADHVAAMLSAIPAHDPPGSDLRFLALIHDSFKATVRQHKPSADNDHAALARRLAEGYTADERLLTTLELHDEPYRIWRTSDEPEQALRQLLEQLPDLELFARFVELDATNEGKALTFLWWFRHELARGVRLPTHSAADTGGPDQDVVYVKAFATTAEQQPAVAHAANELIAEQRTRTRAAGKF